MQKNGKQMASALPVNYLCRATVDVLAEASKNRSFLLILLCHMPEDEAYELFNEFFLAFFQLRFEIESKLVLKPAPSVRKRISNCGSVSGVIPLPTEDLADG